MLFMHIHDMISINQIKYRGTNDINKKIYADFPIP